ncbi:MAG: ABC transporter ATP-binding protein [Anaerolineae bacterium]|nr:ABC transporter ATP-binding protein [Anaerolineae bacterium]
MTDPTPHSISHPLPDVAPDSDAVACCDLRKSFGSVRAVASLSFALRRGELLALLGPSGCGKTTALRLIAGLERPDDGVIRLGGRLVSGPSVFVPANRRRVGLVFQDYALFPHMTVEKNIAYGLAGRDDRRQRVAEMLTLVGLEGLGGRYPHALSGGQQQRVALARALAPQPDIVLLDEPFSNLDVALRRQVREEVQRILREAGVSAILVTHDQEEAMSLADRVGLMFDGTLHQLGTPRDLYERPASQRAALFMGAANLVPGQAHGAAARTALGEVRLIEPCQGAVEVVLRPENLALNGAEDGAAAVVVRQTYTGARQDVWVTLRDAPLTLHITCQAGVPWGVGQPVRVHADGVALAFPAAPDSD